MAINFFSFGTLMKQRTPGGTPGGTPPAGTGAAGEDFFIDYNGKSLNQHPQTEPNSFYLTLPSTTGDWTIVSGAAEVKNSLSDYYMPATSTLAKFWAEVSGLAINNTPAPDNFHLLERIGYSYTGSNTAHASGAAFHYVDADNYVRAYVDGGGNFRVEGISAGVSNNNTLLDTGIAVDVDHVLEVFSTGENFYLLLDNKRYPTSGTYARSSFHSGGAGTYWGLYDTGIGNVGKFHYVTAQAFRSLTIKYYDPAAGGTNSGTISNPYNTWASLKTAMKAADNTNVRYAIKRGSVSNASSAIDIAKNRSGSGTNYTDQQPFEIMGWDPTVSDHLWHVSNWTDISGGWTGPDGNGNYSKAAGNTEMHLRFNGEMREGQAEDNKEHADGETYLTQASLSAGEWVRLSGTIYCRPKAGDDFSTATIEASANDRVFTFTEPQHMRLWDGSFEGCTETNGTVYIQEGGQYFDIRYCKVDTASRGLVYSANGSASALNPKIGKYGRIIHCEASNCVFRAIGSVGAKLYSPHHGVVHFGNYLHDNHYNPYYMEGDEEGIMLGPDDGSDGATEALLAKVFFTKLQFNGYKGYGPMRPSKPLPYSKGKLHHPGGITSDCANFISAYNVLDGIRRTYHNVNPDQQDMTARIYNNVNYMHFTRQATIASADASFNNAGSWTAGTNISVTGGNLVVTSSGANRTLTEVGGQTLQAGHTYEVQINGTFSAGKYRLRTTTGSESGLWTPTQGKNAWFTPDVDTAVQLQFNAAAAGTFNSIEIYEIYGPGDKAGGANRRTIMGLEHQDPNNLVVTYTHNTIIGCDGEAKATSNDAPVYIYRKATAGMGGADTTLTYRYNVHDRLMTSLEDLGTENGVAPGSWDQNNGSSNNSEFYRIRDNNAGAQTPANPNVFLTINNNHFQHLMGNSRDVRRVKYFTIDYTDTQMSDASKGWGTSTEFDNLSTWGDPLLNSRGAPTAGSACIGVTGADAAHPDGMDALLQPRTGNCIGAFNQGS